MGEEAKEILKDADTQEQYRQQSRSRESGQANSVQLSQRLLVVGNKDVPRGKTGRSSQLPS